MNPLQFCVPMVHKKSHATYVIVYVPMNYPLQFCILVVHKKSHATYVIVYAPMNPLQFCVLVVQKISCDFTHALHVVTDF